ncbi:MAG: hypothetical protein ACE5G5_04515 [Candidatus Methylomirabilales bacterium]
MEKLMLEIEELEERIAPQGVIINIIDPNQDITWPTRYTSTDTGSAFRVAA